MRANLLYNKIVAETASESFVESFNKIALPKLLEKFPYADEVVIYEDYLSDSLMANGNFYCPLTLIEKGCFSRVFASWRCDAKRFESSIPYAYLGKEPLNIEISDNAPETIEEKLKGRVPFFAKNSIKLSIEAAAPSNTFLSGRYSQTFVEFMREGLTHALEKEFGISGIADSTLEIALVFLPETFMEHVVDNVSYRRVLLSASACSKRDLWIKWTRLDGKGTYTVSSRVSEGEVLFELCDVVPDKIREREYRYLIRTAGHGEYKNAMSRKNFTEWRELVKRVIKRGEVVELSPFDKPIENVNTVPESTNIPQKFVELPAEPPRELASEMPKAAEPEKEDAFDSEISLKLQSVLEGYNVNLPEESEEEEEEINPDITELLRALISGNGEENGTTGEDLLPKEKENGDEVPPFDIEEDLGEDSDEEPCEKSEESYSEQTEEAAFEEGLASEEIEEMVNEVESEEAYEESSYEQAFSSNPPIFTLGETYDELSEREIEIESLKQVNEELSQKLKEAEAEKERLSELVASYEKKIEESRRERATLIENLDAAKRREERERDRLAEAARLAILQKGDEDKPVYSEEAESAKVKEPVLKAVPLPAEEAPKEESSPLKAESEPEKSVPARYVSKVADISFRHPVDPNITKRIQDIIVTTVKYFGKENVYMKIKATIPDNYMVRLEFVKIPESESELLADIIRVLGHSKLGITKVLLE